MRNIQDKLGATRGEAPAELPRILILPVRHAAIQDQDHDQEHEQEFDCEGRLTLSATILAYAV
jgi:hypothetical protein